MREVHFIPVNDGTDHDIDIDCICQPKLEYPGGGVTFVVHSAADHRDLIEDLVEELAVEMNYDGWEIWVSEEL